MGTDSTDNFDLETVEKPSSTFPLAQTVPISTVDRHSLGKHLLAGRAVNGCKTEDDPF